MSEQLKETERVQSAGGPGRGPMHTGLVGGKATSFKSSALRFVRRMRPERTQASWVIALALASAVLGGFGPKMLGYATDLVFTGLISRRLPEGMTKAEAVAAARARGDARVADMMSVMDLTPGVGVDFAAVGRVLMVVLAIFLVASALAWIQGYVLNDVVQQTVFRLRSDVEDKVNRLPLSYFDRQPRGELLSRVTNDIDNISQTLQQTLSQMLTSLLTVVAVLSMMVWISPLLAVVALVSVPVSMYVTSVVMKRSQGLFIAQWLACWR